MSVTLILASLFVGCLYADQAQEQIDLANSNTAFGINLLNTIQGKEGGNVFLSPFSISTALAMTSLGAAGNTEAQIKDGLQISSYDDPMDRFRALTSQIFSEASNGYSLRQANRLYGQKDVAFKKEFTAAIKKYFQSSISRVDFANDLTREDINLWVEEQTDQKIKNLISEGVLSDDTILVLINAIYFKAFWEVPFDPYTTQTKQFMLAPSRQIDVSMMQNLKKYNHGSFSKLPAQIVELKYKGGRVSMFVILPNVGSTICDVQEGLNIENLNEAIEGMEQKMVRLELPKFEINDKIGLKDYLSSELIGMTDMFGDKADFSKIAELPLYVSAVIHQSFVRVDENGTEAAAATAVIVGLRSAVIHEDAEFKVNRPFVFFIRDNDSKSVLFLGRVVDPHDNSTLGEDTYVCEGTQPVAYRVVDETSNVAGGSGIRLLSLYASILAAISLMLYL